MFKILEKVLTKLTLIWESLLFKFLAKTFAIVALLVGIDFLSKKSCPAGTAFLGAFLGIVIKSFWESLQDYSDTTDWEKSQRKLQRGGFLSRNSIVRISFAYLYRIKIGREYFLVKNERGTGKYQPIGGVYKFDREEKMTLKDIFHVMDDDKISIDESSRNDYRLRLQNKYLRKFIEHFDETTHRENISDLSRELKEEVLNRFNQLGDTPWKEIKYRVCGRHITNIKFSDHFQIYEILLADIVELILSPEQENALKNLCIEYSDTYRLEQAEKIYSFGIDTAAQKLTEYIADHTPKILEEEQDKLVAIKNSQREYTITI
mgnify:CR=1 FL=1